MIEGVPVHSIYVAMACCIVIVGSAEGPCWEGVVAVIPKGEGIGEELEEDDCVRVGVEEGLEGSEAEGRIG